MASLPICHASCVHFNDGPRISCFGREQAVVSRKASIDVLAGIDMLCSGQTGTFTLHGSVSCFGLGRCRRLWRHGQDRLDVLQVLKRTECECPRLRSECHEGPREVGIS